MAENFIVGGNFSVFSPRHYGCFGAAPDGYLPGPDFDGDGEPDYSDGNLTNDLYGVPANARFCGGVVVDRGSRFDTDWLYRTDISFRYDLPQIDQPVRHGHLAGGHLQPVRHARRAGSPGKRRTRSGDAGSGLRTSDGLPNAALGSLRGRLSRSNLERHA
ncbi:MAG: hypothetical protein WDM79_08765 [Terricaulis sp.]